MNKRQSNKLNSYQSVKGVLQDNKPVYENIPIINQTVVSFFEIVDQIDKIATKTEMDTTGETSAKIVAKEKLASLASSLAASGSVWAFEQKDVELEAALAYSYSDLRYARDTETLQISRAIESELLDCQAELADYMVSDENMADLHRLIEGFEDSLEIKGGVKSGSVAETRQLAILYRVADDLLSKKLDRFVVRLKSNYPTFFDAYQNARMIVDL
jgi:hypothetical protein